MIWRLSVRRCSPFAHSPAQAAAAKDKTSSLRQVARTRFPAFTPSSSRCARLVFAVASDVSLKKKRKVLDKPFFLLSRKARERALAKPVKIVEQWGRFVNPLDDNNKGKCRGEEGKLDAYYHGFVQKAGK